jgi:hypothetical protein
MSAFTEIRPDYVRSWGLEPEPPERFSIEDAMAAGRRASSIRPYTDSDFADRGRAVP